MTILEEPKYIMSFVLDILNNVIPLCLKNGGLKIQLSQSYSPNSMTVKSSFISFLSVMKILLPYIVCQYVWYHMFVDLCYLSQG